VPILHGSFSGVQFTQALASMPQVEFADTPRGVRGVQRRTLEDGRRLRRMTEAVLPTLRVVPSPRVGRFGPVESIGWVLAIDDTQFRSYGAGVVTEAGELGRIRSTFGGKWWWDPTEAAHRRMPGDYEAQVPLGPITSHAPEHLRISDPGIALPRRQLARR
jgi:hypothetical protein